VIDRPKEVRLGPRDVGMNRRRFLRDAVFAGFTATVAPTACSPQREERTSDTARVVEDTPIGPRWWPARWGPDDEAGASNWITPAKVLAAASLIKTGKIYDIGRIYESRMPIIDGRSFAFRIKPMTGAAGKNRLVVNEEFLTADIGQVGTQFDGLAHIACQVGPAGDPAAIRYYNGFTQRDIADASGFRKLGIEKVKPFFTRGILVDTAGYRGRMLQKGEEITVAELLAALGRQGISQASIAPGDAIFFNTGWGSLWSIDNARFMDGEPGIGLEVARWAIDRQVSVVGGDGWGVEVDPGRDPEHAFIVHNELITKHGIFLHEALDFTDLLKDRVYEFLYLFAPLRIRGGTGSPGRPLAIT